MSFIGLLRIIEQITRPAGHDDDRPLPCDTGDCWYDAHGHVCPHHCFDGAEQLAEREAEEEVSEPAPVVCLSDGGRCECDRTSQGCIAYRTTETKLADLEADRGTGAINDGEPQLVTLSGREYERYLGGALNEPFVHVAEVCRAHQAEECWVCDEDNDDLWVHPRDVDTEPDDDSLACPYPDCARYVDHRGPHEFPWGDSIPWPPEADLNDDVTPNTEPGLTPDELVGVRGLLQERYEPSRPWSCPVDDCEFEGSSYDEVNTHSYFDHLQPNPFEVSTDPLVEYKRYPGLTKTGDFRWFNVKVTKSSASDHAGTGAEPALGEEPEESLTASLAHPPGYYTLMTDTFASNLYRFPDRPTAGDEHTASDGGKWIYELLGTKGVWDATNYPSPTIVQSAPPPTVDGGIGGGGVLHSPGARLPHPDDAAAEWIGEAVPVISEVLAAHLYPMNRELRCSCGEPNIGLFMEDEWRAHVAPLIANALAPQDK